MKAQVPCSTALAGLAGMLVAPKLNVAAGMGTMFGLKAFAAAIIGGIGSAPGCLIAGLAYGLLEALIAATLPSAWRDILGFALVIVVLAIRPVGLFGRARIEKV
jgi:branched-chain amino acid transport system permease protein